MTTHVRPAYAGRIAGLLLLIVGFAAAASPAAPVARAACPNEALRFGPSALLPECRAYEMVSPPDKGGSGIRNTLETKTTPTGDGVWFFSSGAFSGAPSSVTLGTYVSRRGATNWSTESVSPPQLNLAGLLVKVAIPSPDLSKTLQYSKVALTPGAIEGGSNIYLKDNLTGTLQLVAAKEGNKLFQNMTGASLSGYLGGTPDFSHVVLNTTVPLLPEAPAVASIYEYTDGQLRLVNRLPDGSVETTGAHPASNTVPYSHMVSDDGSRIYWMSGAFSEHPLYLREDGTTTVAVSASQKSGAEGAVANAEFGAASADGRLAYFTSSASLTNESTGAGARLYRYDADSGKLTDLLAALAPSVPAALSPGVKRVSAVSEDGSYVYFTASAALTEDSTPAPGSGSNLYVWHGDQVDLVAQLPDAFFGPGVRLASPSGGHFAFTTKASLTPDDPTTPSLACATSATSPEPEECVDVYHYDALTKVLSCVTCSDSPLGNSNLGNYEFHEHGTGDEYARAVLDDGTVFVDTPSRLVAADVNGTGDAYAWRGGVRWLLSTGTSVTPANFADATPDGSSAFIRTPVPLVPQDIDESNDVYALRVDGGLSGQFPPPAPPPCEGDACRGVAPPPAPLAPAGSEHKRPDDNLPASCLRLSRRAAAAGHRADRLERKARRAAAATRRTARKAAGKPHPKALKRHRKAVQKLRKKAKRQHKRARRLSAKARNCGGQAR